MCSLPLSNCLPLSQFRRHAQGAVTVAVALQQSEGGHGFKPIGHNRRGGGLACARRRKHAPDLAQGRRTELLVAPLDIGMDGEVVIEHVVILHGAGFPGQSTRDRSVS